MDLAIQPKRRRAVWKGALFGFFLGLILVSSLYVSPAFAMIGFFAVMPTALVLGLFTLGSVNWMDSFVPVLLSPVLYMLLGALVGWVIDY